MSQSALTSPRALKDECQCCPIEIDHFFGSVSRLWVKGYLQDPPASANQSASTALPPSELTNHKRERHYFIVTSRWPAARNQKKNLKLNNPQYTLFIYLIIYLINLNSLSWWVVVVIHQQNKNKTKTAHIYVHGFLKINKNCMRWWTDYF